MAASFDADTEGEIIESDPIRIAPILAGSESRNFFGVPSLEPNRTIYPLVAASAPERVQAYYMGDELAFLGGQYAENETLQYEPDMVSPFALQIGIAVLSNYTAWLDSGMAIEGIVTNVQQMPYEGETVFRSDLLFIPFCLTFGFAGLAFSVLDILLMKGQKIIELFRVAGITEWTTYAGVMVYKFTTTFLPFFALTIILGLGFGLVLFGNAGRWLGTLLLMLAYAYSSTPMGLIMAKKFIHGEFKQVAEWFPGYEYLKNEGRHRAQLIC